MAASMNKTPAPKTSSKTTEVSCRTCKFCMNPKTATKFFVCRRFPDEKLLPVPYWCGEWSEK